MNATTDTLSTDSAILTAASQQRKAAFISIKGYRTSKGEVANYLLNGAVDYANFNTRKRTFLVAALAELDNVTTGQVMECPSCRIELVGKTIAKRCGDSLGLALESIAKVRDGYENSIKRCDGDTRYDIDRADVYQQVGPGLKRHSSGVLHVSGLLVRKTTVDDSEKVVKTQRADTIVRNHVKRLAETGLDMPSWVQFKLDGNFERLAMAGHVIEGVSAEQSEAA